MRKWYLVAIFAVIISFGAGFLLQTATFKNASFTATSVALAEGGDITPQHLSSSMKQETFDVFFDAEPSPEAVTNQVVSGVVPHHLLAGRYIANFFESLRKQDPDVVVLIGPNHKQAGRNTIVTSLGNWRTPYGDLSVNSEVIKKLTEVSSTTVDESVIDTEHSVGALAPFIKRTWPKTTLIPLIVKDKASPEEITRLAASLQNILPKNSLVLASVDFSHYLPERVARFHDELSINVLATGNLNRVQKMEIDSQPSIYFLLAYNKISQSEEFHLVSHTNSATIANQPESPETTSHVIGYYTKGQSTEKPITTLQFFGDIMIDRNVAKNMATSGLDYVFKKLTHQENRFFRGADLLVANLEGPFAPARIQTSKSIAFRFDPKWVKQFKKYNFSVLSLANNHTYDMGVKNVAYTRNLLAQNGIGYFGDQLKEGAEYALYVTTTPESIAFVGIENVTHRPNTTTFKKAIEEGKKKANYVIVFPHAGPEYKRISGPKERELYRFAIDSGADAVVAAHPHVIQETEIYNGKPIFYSLGNFIFDQYFSKDTQEGLSVGLVLQDGKVKSISYFPMYSVKSQNILMSGNRRDGFLEWMQENSRLDKRTLENGVLKI